MQPLNDAQLAEDTAILGKVKLDKGLDYETIGKMLIASVLLETKRASTHRSRMSKAVFRLRPDPAPIKFHTEDQGVRVVCCVCELTQPGDISFAAANAVSRTPGRSSRKHGFGLSCT